jgi:hypothetical protein
LCLFVLAFAFGVSVSLLLTNTLLHLHPLSPCVYVVPAFCVSRIWLPVDSVVRSVTASAVVILQDSKTRWAWPLADLNRNRESAIVVVFVVLESIIVVRTDLGE